MKLFCIILIVILGVCGTNATSAEININEITPVIDDALSGILYNAVNVGANFQASAQTTWPKTLNLLIPNLAIVQNKFAKIASSLAYYISELKFEDKSDNSNDVSIPIPEVDANVKSIAVVNTALNNLKTAKLQSTLAKDKTLLKVDDGKIIIPKANYQELIKLLKYAATQFNMVKVGLIEFQQALIQVATSILQNSDNAFGPFLFKKAAIASLDCAKAYGAASTFVDSAIAEYNSLINSTKTGNVALPVAKVLTITDNLLNNLGVEFDDVGNYMAVLADAIEKSSSSEGA